MRGASPGGTVRREVSGKRAAARTTCWCTRRCSSRASCWSNVARFHTLAQPHTYPCEHGMSPHRPDLHVQRLGAAVHDALHSLDGSGGDKRLVPLGRCKRYLFQHPQGLRKPQRRVCAMLQGVATAPPLRAWEVIDISHALQQVGLLPLVLEHGVGVVGAQVGRGGCGCGRERIAARPACIGARWSAGGGAHACPARHCRLHRARRARGRRRAARSAGLPLRSCS